MKEKEYNRRLIDALEGISYAIGVLCVLIMCLILVNCMGMDSIESSIRLLRFK